MDGLTGLGAGIFLAVMVFCFFGLPVIAKYKLIQEIIKKCKDLKEIEEVFSEEKKEMKDK